MMTYECTILGHSFILAPIWFPY